MDSGFQVLVPDFQSVELGFWIAIVSGTPDSLSCIRIPMHRIPKFRKQKYRGFRDPNSLTSGELSYIRVFVLRGFP